jgi:hypothetical protein
MADIVLINPRFEASYWGLEHAMPFLGIKAVLPVANLPLLAALTPSRHSVTLVDENRILRIGVNDGLLPLF